MSAVSRPTEADVAAALSDKVVLTTGAASGIGLATAKLFHSCGAKVIIADVGEDRLKAAAIEIGAGCQYYECNVASWAEQVQMFRWVESNVGTPNIVFCNAGIDPEMKMCTGTAEAEEAAKQVAYNYLADEVDPATSELKQPPSTIMDVNYLGVQYGVKLAVHYMRKAAGGRIIVTGSANSYWAIPMSNMYDASKHAVLGLMRSTATRQDLPAAAITISMLCPSLTATPMTSVVAEENKKGVISSSPSDVAGAVAYLATAPPQHVHGKTVRVKGTGLKEVEGSYWDWATPLFSG